MSDDWSRCGQCRGVRIVGGHSCLAHANHRQRAAALKQFYETGDLDVRGVTVSDTLFKEILAAAPHNTDGHPTFSAARFDQAIFEGRASFDEAYFKGDARFSGATFSGEARFDNATFGGTAWFLGATFKRDAYFGGAEFGGDGSAGATFKDLARFVSATFKRDVYFGGATFGNEAMFFSATFEGTAGFDAGRR